MRLRIREARLQLQISQEVIAEVAGLPVRTYQVLEAQSLKRNFNPTIATLRAVARSLNLGITDLTREPTDAEIKRLAAGVVVKRVAQKKRSVRKV
jgi:transcriptional regulator with XRE-family HTH domain